jgi:hypothetical protein
MSRHDARPARLTHTVSDPVPDPPFPSRGAGLLAEVAAFFNVTDQTLATQLHCDPSLLSLIKRGARPLTPRMVAEIGRVLVNYAGPWVSPTPLPPRPRRTRRASTQPPTP